jgi:hypothetical protein
MALGARSARQWLREGIGVNQRWERERGSGVIDRCGHCRSSWWDNGPRLFAESRHPELLGRLALRTGAQPAQARARAQPPPPASASAPLRPRAHSVESKAVVRIEVTRSAHTLAWAALCNSPVVRSEGGGGAHASACAFWAVITTRSPAAAQQPELHSLRYHAVRDKVPPLDRFVRTRLRQQLVQELLKSGPKSPVLAEGRRPAASPRPGS